jgi:hypothetical protein
LRYVLRPEVMTRDKLFGGTASYMLFGLLWCYFYALADHFSPGSFDGLPNGPVHVADMVFLSFGTLATGGTADIVHARRWCTRWVILEELTGTLFMASRGRATRGELSPPGGDRLTATASRVAPKPGSLRTTSLSGATTPAPCCAAAPTSAAGPTRRWPPGAPEPLDAPELLDLRRCAFRTHGSRCSEVPILSTRMILILIANQ